MDNEKSDIQVIEHKYSVMYEHPNDAGRYCLCSVYFVTIKNARKFIRVLEDENERKGYSHNKKVSLIELYGEDNKETKLKK